jgi:WD40 repeat protein
MRKNSNLTFLSNMEPSEFYQGISSQKKKVGHTSISITEQHLVTNSMDNHIQLFNLNTLADTSRPPQAFSGHKSTFFVKPCFDPEQKILASGSKDRFVYLWKVS